MNIAHSFYEEKEAKMVNAVLDNLQKNKKIILMSEFDRIDKFFKPLSGVGANNLQDDVAHIHPM